MKIIFTMMTLLAVFSCATKDEVWDSGAQRQEAFADERRNDVDENTRDQVPDSSQILHQAQPL